MRYRHRSLEVYTKNELFSVVTFSYTMSRLSIRYFESTLKNDNSSMNGYMDRLES